VILELIFKHRLRKKLCFPIRDKVQYG